ncbi:hypothetical protein, partial [Helicobacter bizzozeronii]|uniref:hypothetical protein n=1 Tax=Helicobacter bizzozeronii TaxID=56877 RepID=UPI0025527F95
GMLDLFEIADWLAAGVSSTSLQKSAVLNTHYKDLKESGWEKYAPLERKYQLQKEVFRQKERHLNRPLGDLKEAVSLYMHYAPQSAGWQKVQKAVESCYSPILRTYSTQRPKFQKDFDALCQHLEPLLKDTPKLSATEELQCWFVLVELERERCLKAWKAFLQGL